MSPRRGDTGFAPATSRPGIPRGREADHRSEGGDGWRTTSMREPSRQPRMCCSRDKVVSRLTFYACVLMGALFLALAAGGAAQGAFAGAIGMALFGPPPRSSGSRARFSERSSPAKTSASIGGSGARALPSRRSAVCGSATPPGRARWKRRASTAGCASRCSSSPHPIVEIEWTDATGKARRAWIGSSEASSLAAAIEAARGSSGRRVAASGLEAGARIATPDREEEADTAERSSDEGAKTESKAR